MCLRSHRRPRDARSLHGPGRAGPALSSLSPKPEPLSSTVHRAQQARGKRRRSPPGRSSGAGRGQRGKARRHPPNHTFLHASCASDEHRHARRFPSHSKNSMSFLFFWEEHRRNTRSQSNQIFPSPRLGRPLHPCPPPSTGGQCPDEGGTQGAVGPAAPIAAAHRRRGGKRDKV